MIGARIGLYEITAQLGQGGMGAVYLAVHSRIGHRKVVKVLLPEHSRDVALLRRFETEARAAARLHHRNITKLDDFNRLATGEWFIMMPFLEGATLDDLLAKTGVLPVHQALRILGQVCAALHAAHGAGIVHRDLKPANIFISSAEDNPQHVTLLDFGIAKMTSEADSTATQTGMAFGTPIYMSAEQFIDTSRADERSDIFALGVIAYQMLTGSVPFGRGSSAALYTRQHEERPIIPPGVPSEWADVILKALALDPRDRHQSAHAFAVALAAATPELPPLPDGVQILRDVAKELVVFAPSNGNTMPARSSARFDAVPSFMPHAPGGSAVAADLTTLSALRGARGSRDAAAGFQMSRWKVAGLTAAAALGSGALIVLVVQWSTPRPAPSSPSVTAASQALAAEARSTPPISEPSKKISLVVEAVPADATLFVNGEVVGPSPHTATVVLGSQLQVRAEKRGFVAQEQMLLVDAKTPKISLVLQRASKGLKRSGSSPTPQPSAPPRRPKFDPESAGGS